MDTRTSTYYFFPANVVFGSESYYFDVDTYVYFKTNVRKMDLIGLQAYVNELDPLAVTRITTLEPRELKSLLQCAINSKFTPNDIKAELEAYRDTL